MINNTLKIYLICFICAFWLLTQSDDAMLFAQKSTNAEGKQATQTEVNEGIEEAQKTISMLTKKIYAKSLFSPTDNDKLIELKMNLYNLWSKNPTNKTLAEPLYTTGQLLIQREMYEEATEILNIVIESFPPFSASSEDDEEESEEGDGGGGFTVDYSAKAKKLLEKMKEKLAKENSN